MTDDWDGMAFRRKEAWRADVRARLARDRHDEAHGESEAADAAGRDQLDLMRGDRP